MQVEAFAIRLRPRGQWEAADLGVRLCQQSFRSVYACYLAAYVPVGILAFATLEIAEWLPMLVLWWAKPWLDRSILFALSRAAFGTASTPKDLWGSQRHAWWQGLLFTLTTRRLSPWRSLTQPVHQLEGLPWKQRRKRTALIRSGRSGVGLLITSAYATVELLLMMALASLVFWFAPTGYEPDLTLLFTAEGERMWTLVLTIAYAIVVGFLEPFYVAAGFAIYLNRRVELEAWDIEQEFRRAFGR